MTRERLQGLIPRGRWRDFGRGLRCKRWFGLVLGQGPGPGRWLLAAAAGLLSLYLGFCGWLLLRQRALLYLPQPRAAVAGNALLRLPGAGGVLEVSAAQRQQSAALLYFGGNAEDVAQTVPSLRALFPQRAIYALHYRGYGGSEGQPSEQALVGDALRLFDQLRPRHPDVGVIGRSLGSGVAMQLAARRPLNRLILITPFASIASVAAHRYPLVPVELLLRDRFDSRRVAPRLGVPSLIVAAGRDEVIPVQQARELAGSFRPGLVRYVEVPEALHNSPLLESPALRPLLRGRG